MIRRYVNVVRSAWFALALLGISACGREPEDSRVRDDSAAVHVCFELRDGAPLQDGLDFYGLFLVEGEFLPGIDDVRFDSGSAQTEIVLDKGVDGESWVSALPAEIRDATVVDEWFLSDRDC